ncbi:hypothetical protein TSUD_330690 [Trifolium subterraneum]|nr:hypothetical protein TSUD_330690 [Trifolium subterraneum]
MVYPNSVVTCDEGGGGQYGVGRDVSTVISCRFVILWVLIEDDDEVIVLLKMVKVTFFSSAFFSTIMSFAAPDLLH